MKNTHCMTLSHGQDVPGQGREVAGRQRQIKNKLEVGNGTVISVVSEFGYCDSLQYYHLIFKIQLHKPDKC